MTNSTYRENDSEDINLETLKGIFESLQPMVVAKRIEVSKKVYKKLAKQFGATSKNMTATGYLFGVEVHIKPYLKKMHIYYNPPIRVI